jgi:hypothetical protein
MPSSHVGSGLIGSELICIPYIIKPIENGPKTKVAFRDLGRGSGGMSFHPQPPPRRTLVRHSVLYPPVDRAGDGDSATPTCLGTVADFYYFRRR